MRKSGKFLHSVKLEVAALNVKCGHIEGKCVIFKVFFHFLLFLHCYLIS